MARKYLTVLQMATLFIEHGCECSDWFKDYYDGGDEAFIHIMSLHHWYVDTDEVYDEDFNDMLLFGLSESDKHFLGIK